MATNYGRSLFVVRFIAIKKPDVFLASRHLTTKAAKLFPNFFRDIFQQSPLTRKCTELPRNGIEDCKTTVVAWLQSGS